MVSVHDATIDRYVSDGSSGRVDGMTLAELKQLDIGSRVDAKWSDQRIPSLSEIFELCQGKIGIYLDVKDASIEQLGGLVREWNMEQDVLWYVGEKRINDVNEHCPSSYPMPDPGPERFLEGLLQRHSVSVVASSWKHFSPRFACKCHERRAIVIVDDAGPATWETLLVWGADGIQTDHPEALIQLLVNRK